MEDVLTLYQLPYDPRFPVVCLDEFPLALQASVRASLPVMPGQPRRADFEYERRGSCNLFMAFQPLAGWRRVWCEPRRRKQEFAHVVRALVDECFPDAEQIRLVCDNLNTHTPAAFYDTFPAEEARRITERVAFHYTPPHGSWLNMVEIEAAVMARQCLGRRLGEIAAVEHDVTCWAQARNAEQASVDWRFSPEAARAKFHRRYPSVDVNDHPLRNST
jgi:hypothetical protein